VITYHDVTVDVAAPVEGKANKHWWIVFNRINSFPLGIACIIYTVSTGIGTWGLNKTVGWISQTSFGGLVSVTLFNLRYYFIPSAMEMAINRSAANDYLSVIQGFISIITWASMVGRIALAYTKSIGSLWVNFNSPCGMYLRYLNLSICFTSFLVEVCYLILQCQIER
jgi:molybdopterin-containing oxidoreductase family membrane subunit